MPPEPAGRMPALPADVRSASLWRCAACAQLVTCHTSLLTVCVANRSLRIHAFSRKAPPMLRSPVFAEIEKLDSVRDHQRIAFLTCRVDFPWDTTRALEFALFRTFCVPAISTLLDKTQEFGKRAQKRY